MRNIEGLLAQKTLFEKYKSLQSYELSPFHFCSIFLWQDFFDFEFEVIDQSLCIFATQAGACFMYLPPLAKTLEISVVEKCFTKMNQINPRTARIENIQQSQLQFFDDSFKAYAKTQEYVYRRQDLIDLKGHAYKSQRHDIHHFQMHHQGLFRPYEESDLKSCLRLYEDWAKNRSAKHSDEIYRSMLEENRVVHELALSYHKPLGLRGFVVEEDKEIVAYSFGYLLNSQTFCVLLEIANVHMTGLNAFIFNRLCASEDLRAISFINTMDDFGMPFVAASKQAYHPITRPVAYIINKIR